MWQFVTSYDTQFDSSRSFADVDGSTDFGHRELLETIRQMVPHSRDLFLFDSVGVWESDGGGGVCGGGLLLLFFLGFYVSIIIY